MGRRRGEAEARERGGNERERSRGELEEWRRSSEERGDEINKTNGHRVL